MDELYAWLDEFICQPHGDIGRSGPVCPFVSPSRAAGTFHVEEHAAPSPTSIDELNLVIQDMVDGFRSRQWEHSNRTLHALVLTFPQMSEEEWGLLDEAQASNKVSLAQRGMMLGQFHPRCDDRAARNKALMVGRSPVPLLALRNMAFHDILFLADDPNCFVAYDARYGRRYETSSSPDVTFVEIYAAARERWLPRRSKVALLTP